MRNNYLNLVKLVVVLQEKYFKTATLTGLYAQFSILQKVCT